MFFEPPRFLRKCNTFHTKTLFFEVRGVSKSSQNGSQNASKIKLRCGGPPGEPQGAILGGFWRAQEAPQRLPRAPRERQESPRRVKMSSRRPQMTLRRPQMTPRRAKRSPRRAKVSSGRLPGAFWEGFPTHFQATRGDRDAPYSNRRRGRAAPEQGYRLALRLVCFRSLPRGRARKLRKRRTRNSRLCLVVLCLASSRRCLCSSPRLLRRLRCLRLSLLTRFPFLDSQVSSWR